MHLAPLHLTGALGDCSYRHKRTILKSMSIAVAFTVLLICAVLLQFCSRPVIVRGAIFPKFAANDIDGHAVSWPTQPFILVYTTVDSAAGIQALRAIHLRQEKRIATPPVISIIHGNKAEILQLRQQIGNSLEVVQDKGLRSWRLGLKSYPFYLFLIDKDSQVTFGSDYAEPEDIRQLAEKTLNGHVSYRNAEPVTALQSGNSFAGFSVLNLRTQAESAFSPPIGGSVLCFTSHCPACDLEQAIIEYARYEARDPKQAQLTLLFSSRFSQADLNQMILRTGIKATVVQADENIPGLEDPLSLETLSIANIVKIDFGANGKISHIAPWAGGMSRQAGAE